MRTAVVIVAAGRGTRAQRGDGLPKQYILLAGKAVAARAVGSFLTHDRIHLVQPVIHADDADAWHGAMASCSAGREDKLLVPVPGGKTRQASVRAGLDALSAHAPDLVLIHDAARPFVSAEVISRVLGALDGEAGVIPGIAVADTLKRATDCGLISATLTRQGLWRAQTPQGFRFREILEAHRQADLAGHLDLTDDAAVAELAGLRVRIVEGAEENRKITTAEDLEMAERQLEGAPFPDVRTGIGFDVHRFADGDHVWLGGVRIAHTRRLDGHSDADVALHALTDALLGAIGDGDIGQHFPPSDPRWRGARSSLFLEDAASRVVALGGRITNVDVTIMCEAPKVGPHREAMRTAIGAMLGVDRERVGVKATTTERLGFTGREEGIAAMATATVVLGKTA